MESKNFDFTAILKIVKTNFKLFALVAGLAIIGSVIFSGPGFLKPRFKSVAIIYPYNVATYSEESQTEQLLQMLESNTIRDAVIEKFNLYDRYEIKPEDANAKYYMHLEYNDRVITSRTKYESVLLEVLDEDPEIAKQMADEVLLQCEELIRSFYHARGQSRSNAFKVQMEYQLAVIDSIETEIAELSKENNLLEFESQSREIMRGYINALSKGGNSKQTEELKTWLEQMEQSGSLYQSLQNISEQATEEYGRLTMKYLDWRAIGHEEVHYFDVVVSPEAADKKMWPVRWLIVLMSVFSACFLTLVILALAKRKTA